MPLEMRSESRRRMGVYEGGGWDSIKRCQQRLWALAHSQHGQVLAVRVTKLPRKHNGHLWASPSAGQPGKPGRAAGPAGWGVWGAVDVAAEAVRGGKRFPPVTSPGLCASPGTQCYQPAVRAAVLAHGPREAFSRPRSFRPWWLLPETNHSVVLFPVVPERAVLVVPPRWRSGCGE